MPKTLVSRHSSETRAEAGLETLGGGGRSGLSASVRIGVVAPGRMQRRSARDPFRDAPPGRPETSHRKPVTGLPGGGSDRPGSRVFIRRLMRRANVWCGKPPCTKVSLLYQGLFVRRRNQLGPRRLFIGSIHRHCLRSLSRRLRVAAIPTSDTHGLGAARPPTARWDRG